MLKGIEVLSLALIKRVMARYQRPPARELSLLPPEPPFGAQKLMQVNTDKMLTPGLPPCEHARHVATFYDQPEAERYAAVNNDIRLLGRMALDLHEKIEQHQIQ